MKTMFAIWVSAVLACSYSIAEQVPPAFEKAVGGSAAAAAEDEIDPFDPVAAAPKLIRVQVEHVELSHKDLTRLLMEDMVQTADAKALRMKVQELVEKNAAKVIDTQLVVGKSGQSQKAESREEFIYPTEFTPEAMDDKMKKRMEEAVSSPFPANPATPTAFESRNLGSYLESQPTLSEDGKTINLNLISELSWHTGNTVWQDRKSADGHMLKISMPDFYVMKTETEFTCLSGQYLLVNALSPKNAEGKLDPERKVMVFVKCDVLSVVP